jgi:hypothetical protein
MHHRLRLLAIGAIATLAGIAQAAANCCPPMMPNCGCGPAFAPVPQMLVVNQGPVYSGPGSYVTQRNYIEGDQVAPIGYPYVGFVPPATVPRYHGGYRPRGLVRPPLRVYGSAVRGTRVVSAVHR